MVGETWRGCAVGCSIQSYNNLKGMKYKTSQHILYEKLFGIPTVLAQLEDTIFEGLPLEDSTDWPYKFIEAIKPGRDLTAVWGKFATWLLTDTESGMINYIKTDQEKEVIQRITALYTGGGSDVEFRAATNAATNAAYAANAAAKAAAFAATGVYSVAYAGATKKQADYLLNLLREA